MTTITCFNCAWFQPNENNPGAGMGQCRHDARHGYFHALAPHRCRDHEAIESPMDDDDAN